MEIFVDGSSSRFGKSHNKGLCSWGVRIEKDDSTEAHGLSVVDYDRHGKFYEQLAFVESVKLCSDHGIKPEECLFVVDDEIVGHGAENKNGTWLFSGGHHHTLRDRLRVLSEVCSASEIDLAFQYVETARFKKIKGHARVIGNMRVDYLAAHARKVFFGHETAGEFLRYNEWMNQGFKTFNKEKEELEIWHPAFV